MENIAVSLEELHAAYAATEALAEANQFRTVPTNYYRIQGTKFTAERNAKTNRLTLNLKADVYKEDKRTGNVGFFVSPEVGRTSAGRLDREFRLYNQLARVLFPEHKTDAELAAISVATLLERFTQYPVGAYITETFSSEPNPLDGKKTYMDAKTDEDAKKYRELGWKPANYVQSIGKLK